MTSLDPPKDQLEEAPNLSQIERGYWLAGNPLPVTEQNLFRGKEVFLDRCVGCHGLNGDGKGPGAHRSSRRRRPTSPTRTTPAAAATPGRATSTTGSCAAGLARRWRTSATVSRSTTSGASCCSSRRSRTGRSLPTGCPSRGTTSSGSPRRSCWPGSNTRQKLDRQRAVRQEAGERPVHARRRCACSRASLRATTGAERQGPHTALARDGGRGDQVDLRGHARPRLGRRARQGREAAARRPEGRPADRAGAAVSRLALLAATLVLAAVIGPRLARRWRSRTTRRRASSRAG